MAKKRKEKGRQKDVKPKNIAAKPAPEIPAWNLSTRLLVAGQIVCLLLLFFAILGVPLDRSLAGGFSGSNAVWKFSLLLAILAAAGCWTGGAKKTDAGKDDIWGSRWPLFILLCVFLMCVNMYVANILSPYGWGLVTGNDQPQYFAYLHSWTFDQDLDFVNEYEMMPGIGDMMRVYHPGVTGHNVAPIGAPIIWMPFYLLTHVFVWILRGTGVDVAADGMSSPYAAGVGFASIFVAWLGFVMIYTTLRKRFSDRAALFSTLLLWLASPILWYMTDEAWMSHACAFFSAALVFWWWERTRHDRSAVQWALLGAGIGLAMMVRPSNVALCALPVVDGIGRALDKRWSLQTTKGLILCLICTLALFAPQLLVWGLRSGFHAPPGNPMRWSRPAIVQILLSAHHGLFAWHPVTLFGFIGVGFLWKKSRHLALSMAAVLALGTYLNASIEDWPAGASFGMRRFVALLPFMAPGLAAFGSWAVNACRTNPAVPVGVATVVLFLYNNLFMVVFREYWVDPRTSVSFWSVWSTQASLFHRSFGNPFSYPANLWFAAKHGVSPGQYDLFGGAPLRKAPTLKAKGFQLRPFLGAGWQTNTRNAFKKDAAFAAVQRNCSILLPLKGDTAYQVEILMSLPKGATEESTVDLALNGHSVGRGKLPADTSANLKMKLEKNVTQDGLNVLELSFAWTRRIPKLQRTSMQGGEGIAVDTKEVLKCAAVLYSLNVTPVE